MGCRFFKMRTILITGSSRGLGRALAFVFAKNGYNLILHCRNSESLKEVKRNVLHECVRCDIIGGDIKLDDTISKIASIAEKRDVDILINNAGIYLNKQFSDMTFNDFREVINTNLIAPIFLTHKIFTIFQKKNSGLIVNINSVAGKNASDGETAYCASKHGLRGFTKSLQFDATRNNIRVIDIYSGAMKTDMSKNRKNSEKFIDVCDMARLIFKICEEYSSMRINEITINRRKY